MSEKLVGPMLGHGEMAVALLKALRIPIAPDRVKGFELHVFAGQVVNLTVWYFVDETQAGHLIETVSTFRFNLEEVPQRGNESP